MSAGFALGPAVAAMFMAISPAAPFWAAAGFSLINAAYGFFVVPESLPKDRRAPFRFKLASFNAVTVLNAKPGLFCLAMTLALAQFATMVFPTVFVLYATHRYNWGIVEVSACLTSFGACSFLIQAGLSGRLVRRFGEHRVILFGMLCAATGAAIFGLAPTGLIYAMAIPVMTLSGVSGPAIQSLMTRQVSSSEQGKLQGANTSLQSLAGIISPMLFGWAYSVAVAPGMRIEMSGAPFLLASLILLIGAGLSVTCMRRAAMVRI